MTKDRIINDSQLKARAQSGWHIFIICAAIVGATIIAYEPVHHNDFTTYDDNIYITENAHVTGSISGRSLLWAFTTQHAGNWHPLTWLSHMLDCELFDLNPLGHHTTSVLIHVANSLLLFWVLKIMTSAAYRSAFVAAVFALHPVHVESVAWAAERKDVLSGLFFFLTIAAYIRYTRRPAVAGYLLVFLLLALGLMAKPMLVTLPFVLLLLDYWPLRRFGNPDQVTQKTASPGPMRRTHPHSTILRLLTEKIPLFALVVISSILTYIVQKHGGAVNDTNSVPMGLRISNAAVSYISYIGKIIYPAKLAVLYPYPRSGLPAWHIAFTAMTLVFITAGVVYLFKRRYLVVGWFWYLGMLVPVLGLIQVGVQAKADRYNYLPSIGILIMITWGLTELVQNFKYRKIPLGISAGLVLVVLILSTRKQVTYWRDSKTLFEHTIAVTRDNYKMHQSLGFVLVSEGNYDAGIDQYHRALEIAGTDPEIHCGLADAFRQSGKLAEAISRYHQAIQLKPDYAQAYNDIGYILISEGKYDEAMADFQKALQIKPDWPPALTGLAQVLLTHRDQNKRDISQATELARRAAELTDYNEPTILDTLGLAYASTGHYEQAIKTANLALEKALAVKDEKMVSLIRNHLGFYEQTMSQQ